MNKNLPQELRDITNRAIAEAQEARRLKQEKEENRVLEEIRKREAEAALIINEIPTLCKEAAGLGQKCVSIMKIEHGQYKARGDKYPYNTIEPADLSYLPANVYQTCQDVGLNPTLEFDHDGIGQTSWFNLMVHW